MRQRIRANGGSIGRAKRSLGGEMRGWAENLSWAKAGESQRLATMIELNRSQRDLHNRWFALDLLALDRLTLDKETQHLMPGIVPRPLLRRPPHSTF